MNKSAFFAALRKRSSGVFGTSLSQTQVEFLEALLDRGAHLDNPSMASVLGNVYHECNMVPKRENMNYSAGRIAEIFGEHRRQGKSPRQLARNPRLLANTVYGGAWGRKNLGNTQDGDGWRFRGGPGPQLTGRANFEKFGIADASEAELISPNLNADIAVRGMERGMFTGKRLTDFFRDGRYDFKGARAIVNNDVGRVGSEVAAHSRAFLLALQAAGRKPQAAQPPETTTSRPVARSGGLAALLKAILSLFGRK